VTQGDGMEKAMNETKAQAPGQETGGPDPKSYLRANLAAWSFLSLLALAAYFVCGAVWDDVTSGVMEFIFVVLGGGFTLVSFIDYSYEKYNRTAGQS